MEIKFHIKTLRNDKTKKSMRSESHITQYDEIKEYESSLNMTQPSQAKEHSR